LWSVRPKLTSFTQRVGSESNAASSNMGCGGSKSEESPPPYNPADVIVYECSDSTDDDDANFIMKAPDGTERKDLDVRSVDEGLAGDGTKMLISKNLMENKTLKFSVVKLSGVDKIVKVEVA
jgi:hypothetical protein